MQAKLLRNALAGCLGVLVFLAGTYIVLRVSGLTQLALTIVGGTGLVGLAVGIAFRDITENFLASIFLSIQRPFETADLVEIVGITGYVQQMNIRTTVLLTLDGNLVQVPNAAVYKSTIQNFTATPKRAYQQYGISMPDEAREVVFPSGIPVTILNEKHIEMNDAKPVKSSGESQQSQGLDSVSTKAEAGLSNEAGVLEEQARQAKPVAEGENLLGATPSARPATADLAAGK